MTLGALGKRRSRARNITMFLRKSIFNGRVLPITVKLDSSILESNVRYYCCGTVTHSQLRSGCIGWNLEEWKSSEQVRILRDCAVVY